MSSSQSVPDSSEAKDTNGTANNDNPDESGEKENTPSTPESPETKSTSEAGKMNDEHIPPVTSSKPETTTSLPVPAAAFEHDPNKLTLKFIFANRDGLHVILESKPTDTVGEVKGALLSMWPDEMPECSGGDRLRLICMGKGILMPDTKTLEAAEVPVFKTHPTPINVSVRPELGEDGTSGTSPKKGPINISRGSGGAGGGSNPDGSGAGRASAPVSSGCSCVIL